MQGSSPSALTKEAADREEELERESVTTAPGEPPPPGIGLKRQSIANIRPLYRFGNSFPACLCGAYFPVSMQSHTKLAFTSTCSHCLHIKAEVLRSSHRVTYSPIGNACKVCGSRRLTLSLAILYLGYDHGHHYFTNMHSRFNAKCFPLCMQFLHSPVALRRRACDGDAYSWREFGTHHLPAHNPGASLRATYVPAP